MQHRLPIEMPAGAETEPLWLLAWAVRSAMLSSLSGRCTARTANHCHIPPLLKCRDSEWLPHGPKLDSHTASHPSTGQGPGMPVAHAHQLQELTCPGKGPQGNNGWMSLSAVSLCFRSQAERALFCSFYLVLSKALTPSVDASTSWGGRPAWKREGRMTTREHAWQGWVAPCQASLVIFLSGQQQFPQLAAPVHEMLHKRCCINTQEDCLDIQSYGGAMWPIMSPADEAQLCFWRSGRRH